MYISVQVVLVLLLSLHMTACGTGQEEVPKETGNGKKLNILMFTDPPFSHIVSLLSVGEELAQRGHNVTLLAVVYEDKQTKYKTHVEKHGVTLWNVSSEDLVSWEVLEKEVTKKLSTSFMLTMLTATKTYGEKFSKIIAKHLNGGLGAGDWDLVISNYFMQPMMCCMHAAHKVPFVFLGLNLLSSPSSHPPWPWPGLLMGAASDNLLLADRLSNVFNELVYYAYHSALFYSMLSSVADYCPSVTLAHTLSAVGTTIPSIMPTVIGLEYPRTISSMTDYVGPLIPISVAPLSGELGEWLGGKPDRSVVYVSMGSMFALDEENGRAIIEGVMKTNYSMLWSLRKSNQWILQGLELDPNRVLISDWTPQLSVLGCRAIHSAILHGGFNGLSEALWNGVPIIVFPQMLEQIFNAGRVHFNGLGIHLDAKVMSAAKIAESLRALDTGEYRSKVSRIQKTFRMAGGVKRAADLVEFYADVGYAHLVPAYAKYQWSWVQYYNADVYAVMVVMLVIALMCLKTCCKCICRRCFGKNKQKKD